MANNYPTFFEFVFLIWAFNFYATKNIFGEDDDN